MSPLTGRATGETDIPSNRQSAIMAISERRMDEEDKRESGWRRGLMERKVCIGEFLEFHDCRYLVSISFLNHISANTFSYLQMYEDTIGIGLGF